VLSTVCGFHRDLFGSVIDVLHNSFDCMCNIVLGLDGRGDGNSRRERDRSEKILDG
jgi:hypothetical protein